MIFNRVLSEPQSKIMKIINNIQEMQLLAEQTRQEKKEIALVPTMGALHEGHLKLMEYGRERSDLLVVSLFVNPLQFGPKEDFEKYPRDLGKDARLAEARGVDILFSPEARYFYPEYFQTYVTVEKMTRTLCGASRPGHFRGVTTVVCKLFHIVKPHLAVFGQKDYQQWMTIRRMVEDLNMDIEVFGYPTVREEDGLAMSSRNVYLSPEERRSALCLSRALNEARSMVREGEKNAEVLLSRITQLINGQPHTRIDYLRIVHPRTLEEIPVIEDQAVLALAVFVGSTRLIDNGLLEIPS
jgi:pantoate--beta-alanine ligase